MKTEIVSISILMFREIYVVFYDFLLCPVISIRGRINNDRFKSLYNFWAQDHITFDLFVSIIFIAGQTLVMFFFVGTGVNVREYLELHPNLDKSLYQRMLVIKRKLYPPTMMVTILFVAMVIVDGAYFIGKISEWWFHILYILTVFYYIKSLIYQHDSFKKSTEIVLEMTENERQGIG